VGELQQRQGAGDAWRLRSGQERPISEISDSELDEIDCQTDFERLDLLNRADLARGAVDKVGVLSEIYKFVN
jgi:hypothetical protein